MTYGTNKRGEPVPVSRSGPGNPFIEFTRDEIEQSIPDRFEKMAKEYADRPAVSSRGAELTYTELNEAANRVAHAILAQCGEAAEPVVLLCENGPAAVAAIYGILKSGKTYVPLDPNHPEPRLEYMLSDSAAPLIVTDAPNAALAVALAGEVRRVINVDEIDASRQAGNPGLSISPDAPAWLLYTSGSTGNPKGVTMKHRTALHSMMRCINAFHLCGDDRVAFLQSLAFSGSQSAYLGTLLNGACLCMYDVRSEGLAGLAKWLVDEEITIYISVPTLLRHFVATLTGRERFPKLRLVRLAGEQVLVSDVALYKRHFSPDCILCNGYGATESGFNLQCFMDKDTPLTGAVVPIGYPLDDMEIMLLDEAGREVEMGETGEIAVRTRYLAEGYRGNPDLTREKFLPDPDGGDRRIYRTGDIGAALADGCFVGFGRRDFQVKIRGHRVEVGEIEAALADLECLSEAVVAARDDGGSPRLIAYYVPRPPAAPTVSELRRHLAQRLPEYMIPSAFVALDALPLAGTGKVNRRALPMPGRERPRLDARFAAPVSPVETALCEIWREVLGLDDVGVDDDFLELGGHSLSAARVAARVLERFNVNVPMASLFAAPTVAKMALVVTQHLGAETDIEQIRVILDELEGLRGDGGQARAGKEN